MFAVIEGGKKIIKLAGQTIGAEAPVAHIRFVRRDVDRSIDGEDIATLPFAAAWQFLSPGTLQVVGRINTDSFQHRRAEHPFWMTYSAIFDIAMSLGIDVFLNVVASHMDYLTTKLTVNAATNAFYNTVYGVFDSIMNTPPDL